MVKSRYAKVADTILATMQARSYHLAYVKNGGCEKYTCENYTIDQLMDEADACDEANLIFKRGEDVVNFYLVYGNDLNETICDVGYTTPQAEKDADFVDEVIECKFGGR